MTRTDAVPLKDQLSALLGELDGAPEGPAREEALARLAGWVERTGRLLDRVAALREEARGALARAGWSGPGKPARSAPPQQDHLGASTFVEKGWHALARGEGDVAGEALERALALAPGDPEATVLLGWARILRGDLDGAHGLLSRALEGAPDHALGRVIAGLLCLQRRRFGEAIEQLSWVIHQGRDRKALLYAHYHLGLVYLERRMLDDAIPFFEEAIRLGPNLVEARYGFGRALWHAGRPEEAETTWRGGVGADRSSPWAARCEEALAAVRRGEAPRSYL